MTPPPALDPIYTADWFQRVEAMERQSARVMSQTIYTDLRPRTVLDFGAGPCGHANALASLGCSVTAVDGSSHAAAYALPSVRFIRADLRRPFQLDTPADVVLCLEVLEHIEEDFEDTVCDMLARHAGRWLVCTAAPPGQRGRNHINLKPIPHWITQIRLRGLIYEPAWVGRWQPAWRDQDVMSYFIDNLMVFRRHPAIERSASNP